MKVLLVGNYEFDGSTSMKIWANSLLRELLQRGIDVELISPKPVFGRLRRSAGGLGKWLGYIDRFVIFPRDLRAAAAKANVVHLCDHGSAVYATMVKNTPVVVTCNDMVAVRGALGEVPDCPASFFGRLLQNWICRGLKRATRVACISQATYDDARRILKSSQNLCVILDALNYPFELLPADEVNRRLAGLPEIQAPFILHVGSSLARKNREGVLRIFAKVAEGTRLQLVFAGEALNAGLIRLAKELKVNDRVVQVIKPDVKIIEALYNRAVALLFPSRYEGFGWPPIEAQACGCPVVGSDIPPLAEVLRQSAELRPVTDEAGMEAAIRKIVDDREYRERLRQRGFENVRARFQTTRMMDEYVSLYRELACQS
jgi:glycosyltransferase involved in cell wall biosynthesis